MFYLAIYDPTAERWQLSWDGKKAKPYTLTEALQAYAYAVKMHGMERVMLLTSVSIQTTTTARLVHPEHYGFKADELGDVTV